MRGQCLSKQSRVIFGIMHRAATYATTQMSRIRILDNSTKGVATPETKSLQALIADVPDLSALNLADVGKLMMPLGKLVDAQVNHSSSMALKQAWELGAAHHEPLSKVGWPRGDDAFNTFVLNYFEWNNFWRRYSPDSAKWYRVCFDRVYEAFLKGIARPKSPYQSSGLN